MNNKLTITIALLAGLLGGQITRFLSPSPAFAQNPAQPVTKEIRAQSFTLVDASGFPVGTFTAEVPGISVQLRPGLPNGQPAQVNRQPVRIVLRDARGREIWSAGGSALVPLSLK
jgi:hypothetical protein